MLFDKQLKHTFCYLFFFVYSIPVNLLNFLLLFTSVNRLKNKIFDASLKKINFDTILKTVIVIFLLEDKVFILECTNVIKMALKPPQKKNFFSI